MVFGSHQAWRDIDRGVPECQSAVFAVFLGDLGPEGRRFGRRRPQSGRRLAASRRSRILAQAGKGGAQAHSCICGLAAWGCVSVREHVLVIGHLVHIATRFVGAWSRAVRWERSARRGWGNARAAVRHGETAVSQNHLVSRCGRQVERGGLDLRGAPTPRPHGRAGQVDSLWQGRRACLPLRVSGRRAVSRREQIRLLSLSSLADAYRLLTHDQPPVLSRLIQARRPAAPHSLLPSPPGRARPAARVRRAGCGAL